MGALFGGGPKIPTPPPPPAPPPPPPTLANAAEITPPRPTAGPAAGGLASTILTSPMGVLGQPQTSRKTLLGA